jgi:hypothetical protein
MSRDRLRLLFAGWVHADGAAFAGEGKLVRRATGRPEAARSVLATVLAGRRPEGNLMAITGAITGQTIVERIQQQLGSGWKDPSVDTILAGDPDAEVKAS